MKKIVLATAAGVFFLSACGKNEQKPEATAASTTSVEVSASATDKAAIDALGQDVQKLADAYLGSTGPKQVYAEKQLVAALKATTDAEAVSATAPRLPQMTEARMAAVEASIRLRK